MIVYRCVCVCVTLCNVVTSITSMCVCVSLPCYHLFIPIESSIELDAHNTPLCLTCIHMTHLYFLVKALVVYCTYTAPHWAVHNPHNGEILLH